MVRKHNRNVTKLSSVHKLIIFTLLFDFCRGIQTVRYAAIIYRHGDRTPVDPYPTDPYKNESLWPVKFGQLTNTGKKQHYNLGKWLRSRYLGLLSEVFDPSQMHVRSTDVDRTLMSAQANLAGMFPPVGPSIWDNTLLWQPVPVHTVPVTEDNILAMMKPCKAYDLEKEDMVHSKDYQNRLSKYKGLMDYLSKHTGKVIKDYLDIEYVYNTLFVENLYNFTLPEWTKSVFPDKMLEPSCYSFSVPAAEKFLARLKVGPFMKALAKDMTGVAKRTSNLKLSIYSAHDDTIGNILTAMKIFDGNCPPYTATILIDLMHDYPYSEHFVRISYKTSEDEPRIISIPECGKLCPLPRFLSVYNDLISVRWEKECNMEYVPSIDITFFATFAMVLTACILYKTYVIYSQVPESLRAPIRFSTVYIANPAK